MQTTTDESVIIQKTRELCQAIIEGQEFQGIRRRIDTFLADDQAKAQYQTLSETGEFLQHKQQQGIPLSNEEIADFETKREAFLSNPVATDFLEAQQQMHKLQESVNQYVSKTFELGRVPAPDEMGGGCGHGCGCHH
ncbi:MAG: YlbF family regulator [Verrucomicrobiota bacterium]|jgi:cell fate (sporulation/competence/biofilm development) regulator YlbF (YheA/YmcA/DUF963 family)